MDKIRTFIAVELTQEIRKKLYNINNLLARSNADAKWVSEENFHITMKFLGDVPAAQMDAIKDAITQACAESSTFSVEVTGLGAFPRLTNPSVVWAGISSGADELSFIANRLESSLFQLGIKKEERKFSAHITIGRVRSKKGAEILREEIKKHIAEKIGSCTVSRIALMKSDLRSSGPVYTPIAYFSLKDPDAKAAETHKDSH